MPVVTAIELITPDVAKDLLARNVLNRGVRTRQVRQIAEAMAAGRWDFNGESIKIAEDGTLLDGQHRLMGVCEAGVAIQMVVVRGLAAPAQDTMDTGRRRTLSDVLAIAGYVDAVALAAGINALHRYYQTNGFARSVSPTIPEALDLLKREPTIADSVKRARNVTNEIRGPVGVFAACHHVFASVDPRAADEFFRKLELGDELDQGDPIYHLRRHVLRTRKDRSYAKQPHHMAALMFKAFNLWRRGARVTLLTYKSGGSNPEAFPDLERPPGRRRKKAAKA
jgi:hypothetical protein